MVIQGRVENRYAVQIQKMQVAIESWVKLAEIESLGQYDEAMTCVRHVLLNSPDMNPNVKHLMLEFLIRQMVAYERSTMTMKKTGEPPEYAQVALSVLFQILGISPRDFNAIDGLGRSLVSSMLSGGRPMSKSHIQRMSSYLGVPASWFADPAVVPSAESHSFLDDRLTERAVVRR